MRVVRIATGAAGLSMFAIGSAWAQTQFNVILNQNQTVGGSTIDLTQGLDLQTVAGAGSQVGVLGSDNEGNQLVLYYNGTSWSTVMAAGDTAANDTSTVDQFANLAISGNAADGSGTRLTFIGMNNDNSDAGVFQYDVGGAGVQEVAFDGENGLTIPESYGTAEGFMPLAVDQEGNVAFEPYNSSGNLLVMVGNSTSSPVRTTEFTSDPTSDGSAGSKALFQADPLGISTDATGATTFGVVSTPANNAVSQAVVTFSGGVATNISGTFANGVLLMAAQQNLAASVNAALFEANTSPTASEIVLNSNGVNHVMQTLDSNPTGGQLTAEMTPGGQLAYFIPTAGGGALEYYNLSAGTFAPTQVATLGTSVADPFAGGDYVIKGLPTLLQSPMINQSGLIVFDAEIGLAGNNDSAFQAMLDWTGSGSPTVLLYAGETIAGYGPIDPDGIYVNGLTNQDDVFKDSLNDQGYLNVMASIGDGTSIAVLQTDLSAVPEPTALAMLPIGGAVLLRRRRHARI